MWWRWSWKNVVKCKCKAAANERELVQHAIRDEHKRSSAPSESYQSDFRAEVVEWRCGVTLDTEKTATAIKCDDADR
jgi:hypothetical protein